MLYFLCLQNLCQYPELASGWQDLPIKMWSAVSDGEFVCFHQTQQSDAVRL